MDICAGCGKEIKPTEQKMEIVRPDSRVPGKTTNENCHRYCCETVYFLEKLEKDGLTDGGFECVYFTFLAARNRRQKPKK